jgi:hypothetical protein
MSDFQRSEKSVKALQVAYDRSSASTARTPRKFAIWGLGALIIAAMTVWIGVISWGLFTLFEWLMNYFE